MSDHSHLPSVPDPPDTENEGKSGGGGFDSRLARLETHIEYLATKEDLQKLKVWWLGGIIAGMGVAATIATAVALGLLRIFYVP